MIFAVTQDLVKYDVMCTGVQIGLYSTYFGSSPVLFNLITRTSLIPFQYEAFSTVKEPFFIINNDELYEKTLSQKVGERTVERLCCELSPIQMLELFEESKDELTGLGILEYWHSNVDLLLDVMQARALTWKRTQRGRINSGKGGVIVAQFGSLLTEREEKFILAMNPYHRDFKREVEA